MQLWRIHIKPESEPGVDALQLCLDRQILGIGWSIGAIPIDKDDYWNRGKVEFAKHGRSWTAAAYAVLYRMNVGDLVWTRNRVGTYYIGRIVDEWQYKCGDEFKKADIANARPCEWHMVGTMDEVPGSVVNAFRSSANVQRIYDQTALLYSRCLMADLTDHTLPSPDHVEADILQLLSTDDLEDVVALYLQIKERLLVLPSSCKKDTWQSSVCSSHQTVDVWAFK